MGVETGNETLEPLLSLPLLWEGTGSAPRPGGLEIQAKTRW